MTWNVIRSGIDINLVGVKAVGVGGLIDVAGGGARWWALRLSLVFSVENEKVRSLNIVKFDVVSENVRHTVDICNIIARTKPDIVNQLISVAAESA